MQINIAESIRETLAELNPVGLYGIGTLSLVHNPASFGEQRKSLRPPSMKLHFSESNSSNTHLFNWLQEKYNISTHDAEKAFKKFCEKLLNALVNYGKVNIKGIASFKQDENMSLACTPDQDFVNLFYKGLPEIPVSHIDRRDLSGYSPLVPIGKVINNDDNESDDISSISNIDKSSNLESDIIETTDEEESIEFVREEFDSADEEESFELIKEEFDTEDEEESFEFVREEFDAEDEEESFELRREDLTLPVVIPKSQDNTKTATKEEVNKTPSFDPGVTWDSKPVNSNYEADSIFNGRNIALLLGLLLLLILCYFGCQKLFNLSNDSVPNADDKAILENTIMTYADSLENGLIENEEFTFKGVPLPDKCIIITGAFKRARNSIRMHDKLLREGYDVFQSVEGGLTRVGFKFDCKEVDLEEYLQNIRRTISKKAWYLDPSLYVEYEQ